MRSVILGDGLTVGGCFRLARDSLDLLVHIVHLEIEEFFGPLMRNHKAIGVPLTKA